MPLIYLIRHGRTDSADPQNPDPGLDATGHEQAREAAAQCVARQATALPLLCSPLQRCRETAAPLARAWATTPVIEPRVRELPSPMPEPPVRAAWLREVLPGNWPAMAECGETVLPGYGRILSDWRDGLLQTVLDCPSDSVIVTHFVAINSLVAQALDSDRVSDLRPDNGSITLIETNGSALIRLIERGREMTSQIG